MAKIIETDAYHKVLGNYGYKLDSGISDDHNKFYRHHSGKIAAVNLKGNHPAGLPSTPSFHIVNSENDDEPMTSGPLDKLSTRLQAIHGQAERL